MGGQLSTLKRGKVNPLPVRGDSHADHPSLVRDHAAFRLRNKFRLSSESPAGRSDLLSFALFSARNENLAK
jgi:hypothetical protein